MNDRDKAIAVMAHQGDIGDSYDALDVELYGYVSPSPSHQGRIFPTNDPEDLPEQFRQTWIPLYRHKGTE